MLKNQSIQPLMKTNQLLVGMMLCIIFTLFGCVDSVSQNKRMADKYFMYLVLECDQVFIFEDVDNRITNLKAAKVDSVTIYRKHYITKSGHYAHPVIESTSIWKFDQDTMTEGLHVESDSLYHVIINVKRLSLNQFINKKIRKNGL